MGATGKEEEKRERKEYTDRGGKREGKCMKAGVESQDSNGRERATTHDGTLQVSVARG